MLVAISAATELGFAVSAFQIIPFLFYPFLLLISSARVHLHRSGQEELTKEGKRFATRPTRAENADRGRSAFLGDGGSRILIFLLARISGRHNERQAMGGFFGAAAHHDVVLDVFFGVDYHSHLGTKCAGMIFHDAEEGCFQREIHSIQNTPFRRASKTTCRASTVAAASAASATPTRSLCWALAPGHVRHHHGGRHQQRRGAGGAQLRQRRPPVHGHELGQGEHHGARRRAHQPEGRLRLGHQARAGIHRRIAHAAHHHAGRPDHRRARQVWRLPVLIGKSDDGFCISFESFAYHKLGYRDEYELGPGEIVLVNPDEYRTISPAGDKMKICAFLWVYYGYPNSNYEGVNVEVMRYRNGAIIAHSHKPTGGVPDSTTWPACPTRACRTPSATRRSARPPSPAPSSSTRPHGRARSCRATKVRNRVAKMKQIHIPELINEKKLLFVDDSIVRGTQLNETVDFLYKCGAEEVHMRSACPPIMFSCKYLSFSSSRSDMELLARRMAATSWKARRACSTSTSTPTAPPSAASAC